jgi:hypothetical protein
LPGARHAIDCALQRLRIRHRLMADTGRNGDAFSGESVLRKHAPEAVERGLNLDRIGGGDGELRHGAYAK